MPTLHLEQHSDFVWGRKISNFMGTLRAVLDAKLANQALCIWVPIRPTTAKPAENAWNHCSHKHLLVVLELIRPTSEQLGD